MTTTLTPAIVVNRALQLIGGYNDSRPVTGSPPNFDNTTQGIAAGVLYDGVVQTVTRQFGWDFSRATVLLTLTGATAPFGFAFQYVYPSTAVQILQLVAAADTDHLDPRPVEWVVGNSSVGTVSATGSIHFTSNPSPGDTIRLDGVLITFVSGTPVGHQVQISGTTALTIDNLITILLPTITSLDIADYTETGGPTDVTFHITVDQTLGEQGNNYTLAASAATPSGATCTGGVSSQQKVIWTSVVDAFAIATTQPAESTWDALFTEAVVRLLASELAPALPGKPETAAAILGQGATFERDGQTRTDT